MALTVAQFAKAKALPEQFLRDCGLYDGEALVGGKAIKGVVIPYGDGARARIRTHVVAKQGSYWVDGTDAIVPYGLRWQNSAGETVLCEGETDALALLLAGIAALGIPGTTMQKVLCAEHLDAIAKVWISREPDKGGESFVEGMVKHLRTIGYRGAIYELRMPEGYKDPHALYAATGDAFKDEVEHILRGAVQLERALPAIDGATLLDDVAGYLHKYIAMPAERLHTVALFDVYTHAYDLFSIAPYLAHISPTPGCAKTTLLDVQEPVVREPLATANTSTAALFRAMEEFHPTLIIDETDAFFAGNKERAEDLRSILNAGSKRGKPVLRCEGKNHVIKRYDPFGPKILAGLKRLPETLRTRSIVVCVQKSPPGTYTEYCEEEVRAEGKRLHERIAEWVKSNRVAIRAAIVTMPEELDGRTRDKWRPLFAVAQVAGGEWPKRVRKAAIASSTGDAADDQESSRITLLWDLYRVFNECNADRLGSRDLITGLCELPESPWAEFRRGDKPLDEKTLKGLLADFEIRPKQMTIAGKNMRGYERAWFEATWRAYANHKPAEENGTSSPTQNDAGDAKSSKPQSFEGDSVVLAQGSPSTTRNTAMLHELSDLARPARASVGGSTKEDFEIGPYRFRERESGIYEIYRNGKRIKSVADPPKFLSDQRELAAPAQGWVAQYEGEREVSEF